MFSCLTASPKKKSNRKPQPLPQQQSLSPIGGGKISTRKLLGRLLPQPPPPPQADAVDDNDGGVDSGRGSGRRPPSAATASGELQRQLHALLKHLHSDRLAKLAMAVEIGTTGGSDCVRLEPGGPDSTELQLGRHRINARSVCLRAWRFPDLVDGEPLTPLTEGCCSRLAGQCVNPFHFYRTVAAAPDLQYLVDRLSQLELKLPLTALSDNEVSSSGCSSDSLLSGRKSWLTNTSANSATTGGLEHRPGGVGGSCSCSCCSCCSAAAGRSLSGGGSGSWCSSCSPGQHQHPQHLGALPHYRDHQHQENALATGDNSSATNPDTAAAAGTAWCALAYWEGRSRVGQLVHVRDPAFHVFQRRPLSDGLSLEALASVPANRGVGVGIGGGVDPDGELARQAAKTRAKIGAGVTLVRRRRRLDDADDIDGDGIDEGRRWRTELLIFNQSEHSVFVHSPTLQPLLMLTDASATATTAATAPYQAVKLPPHSCLKAFDSAAAGLLSRARQLGLPASQCAAADPYTVRLSFVKGFGSAYQRQDIIYCPCWLEVMLSLS